VLKYCSRYANAKARQEKTEKPRRKIQAQNFTHKKAARRSQSRKLLRESLRKRYFKISFCKYTEKPNHEASLNYSLQNSRCERYFKIIFKKITELNFY
jgi:hypothetical protein